jgi:hypothetical protein
MSLTIEAQPALGLAETRNGGTQGSDWRRNPGLRDATPLVLGRGPQNTSVDRGSVVD